MNDHGTQPVSNTPGKQINDNLNYAANAHSQTLGFSFTQIAAEPRSDRWSNGPAREWLKKMSFCRTRCSGGEAQIICAFSPVAIVRLRWLLLLGRARIAQ
jgi:hypothetical protein